MKLNRNRVVTGLVVTGLAAGAPTGGGVALASAGAAAAPATSTPASPSCWPGRGHLGGMDGMDMPHSPGTGMGSHMTGTDSPRFPT